MFVPGQNSVDLVRFLYNAFALFAYGCIQFALV